MECSTANTSIFCLSSLTRGSACISKWAWVRSLVIVDSSHSTQFQSIVSKSNSSSRSNAVYRGYYRTCSRLLMPRDPLSYGDQLPRVEMRGKNPIVALYSILFCKFILSILSFLNLLFVSSGSLMETPLRFVAIPLPWLYRMVIYLPPAYPN